MRSTLGPAPDHDGEAGFSLIETLVAFIVLSMALTAFFQSWSIGLNGLSRLEKRERAMMLAASVLEQVGTTEPARPGSYGGEDDDGVLSWDVTITPIDAVRDGRSAALPLRIDVRVTDGSGAELTRLATLRYGVEGP